MENKYFIKYLKYKKKYLSLKNQMGGGLPSWWDEFLSNLISISSKLNEKFISKKTHWVLGGSSSVVFLTWLLEKEINDDFPLLNILPKPNDIDIILFLDNNQYTERFLLGRTRVQDTIETSMTFSKEGIMGIDLIDTINTRRIESITFYNIPINDIFIPVSLLRDIRESYEDNLPLPDDKKLARDKKRFILSEIKDLFFERFIVTKTFKDKDISRRFSLDSPPKRMLFGDDSDDSESLAGMLDFE